MRPEARRFHDQAVGDLIGGSGVVLGVIYAVHVPTKPAITLVRFLVGLPAA